jgi:predicted N-acetyltransferase YhbS
LDSDPSKFRECIDLIEKSFNYNDDYHFDSDFSLLTNERNYPYCYFIQGEQGDVIATLFTLPRKLTYKGGELDVLFLGGISVKDENRGGGIFKTLLETVILMNGDCGLFLLWSDLSNLYEKFSFYEFGLIEEIESKSESQFELNPISKEERNKVVESYLKLQDNYLLPIRGNEDWNELFDSPSIQNHSDKKGNFYFLNKGMDLQGICHESHPMNSPDLDGFSSWKVNPQNETNNPLRYMGFLRLGNLEVINGLITETSGGRLSLLDTDDEILKVQFDGETYELGHRDFIQGIWGPGQIEEWKGLVPPIVVFGFDSI